MANVEKLEEVLTYIKDHPEEHDQTMWFCGSTACFAGHTVMMEGWQQKAGNESVVTKPGVRYGRSVPSLAAEILGLTTTEGAALFYASGTLDEVEQTVKAIANGEDVIKLFPEYFMDRPNLGHSE